MRIIGGSLRGRKLIDCSKFKNLRPTSDKNRQMIFNIIEAAKFIKEINFKIAGAKVLDLCSGSGAFSFEALSRGADFAMLVDNNQDHLNLAKENAKKLQLTNQVKPIFADLKSNLKITDSKFDLIFFDPPYNEDYQLMISNLVKSNFISPNAVLIIEFKTSLANQITNQLHDRYKFKLLDLRKSSATTSFAFFTIPNSI